MVETGNCRDLGLILKLINDEPHELNSYFQDFGQQVRVGKNNTLFHCFASTEPQITVKTAKYKKSIILDTTDVKSYPTLFQKVTK